LIETIVLAGIVYLLTTLFPLALGHAALSFCPCGNSLSRSPGLNISIRFCLGAFLLCLLTVGLGLSGLEVKAIRVVLALVLVGSLSLSLSGEGVFRNCSRGHLVGYLLGLLATLFCSLYLCFPNGLPGEALVDTSMYLTGLPVDLMIPYNFSRMIIEGIDPNSIDIVPGWSASDRGPVAGLLNASIFYLTGLVEDSNWMGGSQGLFFLYQSLVISLNCLALVIVWFYSFERYGVKAAAYTTVTLLSCYFVILNLMFAWPKFFMAAIILTSLWLWLEEKRWFLSGGIAGFAMLTHDSAIFTIAAFGLFAFFQKFLKVFSSGSETVVTALKDLAIYPLGFALTISPWLVAKFTLFETSPRLVYMHLFCYTGESLDGVSFSSLAKEYFEEKGFLGALGVRLENILYPFDFGAATQAFLRNEGSVYSFINSISYMQFFQIGVSVGPLLIFVFFMAIISEWQQRKSEVAVLNAVAFLSLVFISLISGCLGNTVSHIWAYPAFLTFAIAIGSLMKTGGGLLQVIFSLGVGINTGIAGIYFFYRPIPKPFLHGSEWWYSGLFLLGISILILLIWAAVNEQD